MDFTGFTDTIKLQRVLYCVMYSSMEIALISLVFVILDLVNLHLIISG